MITEERDKLRDLVNEFKRLKNDEAGDETVSGTLIQVIIFFLVYLFCSLIRTIVVVFVCDFVGACRSLNHLLQRKNRVLKD